MKPFFLTLLYITSSLMSFSQSNIEGIWQPDDKNAIFRIYEENGKFYGQLIGSKDPEENKKIKEKERIVLLRNLKKKSETEYCCGIFIAPETKTKLSAAIILISNDRLKLKLNKGWFTKSIIWNRFY